MPTNALVSRFLAGDRLPTAILVLSAASRGETKHTSRSLCDESAAREMLSAFLQPGADVMSLSLALRPTANDYAAVFASEFAAKLQAMYEPLWESGTLVLSPKGGQTELVLHAIPSAEIKTWTQVASDHLPGGYEKIRNNFKSGFTVYAFTFVAAGDSFGTSFDGLVRVNGQWRIFPKPFRAERERAGSGINS